MKKVKLNLNRLHYSLIALFVVALLSVGVYALGTTPNPGHSLSQLQGCDSSGQTLIWSGTAWTCGTASTSSSGTSYWAASGSNIYYNNGSVGLGTSSPVAPLTIQTASGSKGLVFKLNTGASGTNSPFLLWDPTAGGSYEGNWCATRR